MSIPRLPSYAVVLLLALIVSAFIYSLLHTVTSPPVSTIADFPADFSLELADTEEKRMQGLSGRSYIPENYGMLFVFPEPGRYLFWMKNMQVSIDIIWIGDDAVILGIEHNISPESYPKTFSPPSPARYVLETKAGEATRLGWQVGTKLPLPK